MRHRKPRNGTLARFGIAIFLLFSNQFACASDAATLTDLKIELIKPGLVIENGPPEGWTHLIIKSHPRIADEELKRTSGMTARLASFIFTAFTARVEPPPSNGPPPYRIASIGAGIGVSINGKDIVVTPDTQKELGANLGILARTVFSIAFDRQNRGRVVAATQTLALVDTFAIVRRENRNRIAVLRYALVLDSKTGSIDTLLWMVDKDTENGEMVAHNPIQWLPPNKIEHPRLFIDDNEYTLGVPSNNAFGVIDIPQGDRKLLFPPGLRPLAGASRYTATEMAELEQALRQAMNAVQARRGR